MTGVQTCALPIFPELRWVVHAPRDVWGTSVTFTSGPFIHTQHPQYRVDCRLHLRLLQAAGPSQWQVGAASDATNLLRNDPAAVVTASSTGHGAAMLGLRATFIPPPGDQVPAGDYVTQVVGLVTGI